MRRTAPQAADRFAGLAEMHQGHAESDVRAGLVRREPDRLAERRRGFAMTRELAERHAEGC